jgi:hypothetical protein
MKIIQVIITCAVIFIVTAAPAKANNPQYRSHFESVIIDSSGCAGEDGLAQGMVHVTVANMPGRGVSEHINAQGTWIGLETGNEAKWLDNINDVLPITGENVVYTFQRRLRILGQGPGGDFFLRYKFHVTDIGGEVTAYFDSATTECTV